MYWIYLIIFTFIVFIPSFVRSGTSTFNLVQVQEFVILILGSLGFFLFLIQEKRLKRNIKERGKIQRQVNQMTKDLTHSYSYIGEINRKLDILENIALGYPESSQLSLKEQNEIYDTIMGAIELFGKSDEFTLRFIGLPNLEIVKEIKSLPDVPMNFSIKEFMGGRNFFQNDEYIVTNSPKAIDGIFSCIIIKKKSPSHNIEDVEMMKTLASQALFLYMFLRQKKQIKCVI